MSNRTLSILIIFGFIAAGFLAYQYFFVFNLVSLTIESNIGDYRVELKNIKSSKTEKCLEKKCEILELSPFEYNLIVSKQGYTSYNKVIKLDSSKTIKLKLEKKIVFEKLIKPIKKETKKTRDEIIESIKKNKASYKIINIENIGEFLFKEVLGKLELFYFEKKLATFPIVKKENINIYKIIGDTNYILVDIAEKKYLINLKNNKSNKVNLKSNINYIKKTKDKFKLQIVTEDGTFIYNLKDKSINYFSRFSDFVIIKDGFIALVNKEDVLRKKNLGLEDKKGSLIVYLNTLKSEKSLLKELGFNIAKILLEEDYVKIISEEGEEYRLSNY